MWRPKEWKSPCAQEEDQTDFSYHLQKFSQADTLKIFEAGADAMLQAIRSRGHIRGESLRNVKGNIGWASINPDSKWYPIPEDE